uniref:Uncharacterized protein n=1 Tax=Parascaris univalens TaxID=6257 RepID=A0A915ANZ9_PARUN
MEWFTDVIILHIMCLILFMLAIKLTSSFGGSSFCSIALSVVFVSVTFGGVSTSAPFSFGFSSFLSLGVVSFLSSRFSSFLTFVILSLFSSSFFSSSFFSFSLLFSLFT